MKRLKMLSKLLTSAMFVIAMTSTSYAQMSYDCPTCPQLNDRPVVNLSTLADAQGNLTADHTLLTCENMYIMDMKIYVTSGKILTILPGTVVKAEPQLDEFNSNALIVSRGGKIYAEGSECCPIIFTALEDPLDGTYSITNKEKWGGIIILGYAQNNVAAGELNPENENFQTGGTTIGLGLIEGVDATDPRHQYGMEGGAAFINDDNSGVLKYVSIRHGGSELGDANEINGLTLGSVGSKTVLRFIEVVSNGDDGIEFFGGTVDLKYARIMYCEDDYIDWDQGYVGRIQHVLGVQLPSTPLAGGTSYKAGDNGMECDGDDGDDYPRPFLSDPIVSNVTIIGDAAADGDKALELKERTKGQIYNSIFANFDLGINYVVGTNATVENNTFVNATTFFDDNGTGYTPDATNLAVASINGFDPNFSIDASSGADVVINGYDAMPLAGSIGAITVKDMVAIDTWFDAVNYRGAINPDLGAWWNMESCGVTGFVPRVDIASNAAVSCPTDINADGVTNASDLGQIIANYGINCLD